MNKNFWQNKRVFITGHTGFKGSWLTQCLLNAHAKIAGYALKPDTTPSLFTILDLEKKIEQSCFADIRDLDLLKIKMQEFQTEIVFHLAAQPLVKSSYEDPVYNFSTNLMGTVNLFEAVRAVPSVKTVVNVTTDKVYENTETGEAFSEDQPLGGYDPYSASKACSEIITSSYRRSFLKEAGVKVASARAGNVFGGGDWAKDRLVPDLMKAFASGKDPVIRNPGYVRPWQHVLEPISGYILLAEQGFDEAFNFGPQVSDCLPVQSLVEKVIQNWDPKIGFKIQESHFHEAHLLKLDNTKAEKKLGWKPRWNVDQAIEKTTAWYKAFYSEKNMSEMTMRQIAEYFS